MQSACALLHCHLWPVRLYHILPHYLINGTITGKKVLEHRMRVLIDCEKFEASLILRIIQKDIIINVEGGSNMTGTKCGLFTHKSIPVIFEPLCTLVFM